MKTRRIPRPWCPTLHFSYSAKIIRELNFFGKKRRSSWLIEWDVNLMSRFPKCPVFRIAVGLFVSTGRSRNGSRHRYRRGRWQDRFPDRSNRQYRLRPAVAVTFLCCQVLSRGDEHRHSLRNSTYYRECNEDLMINNELSPFFFQTAQSLSQCSNNATFRDHNSNHHYPQQSHTCC